MKSPDTETKIPLDNSASSTPSRESDAALPDPNQNQASTKTPASGVSGLKLATREEMHEFVRKPCVRNSLLYSISTGLFVGLLSYYRKPNVFSASNWAVGGFGLMATLYWPFCVRQNIEMNKRGQVFINALQSSQTMDELRTKLKQSELNPNWQQPPPPEDDTVDEIKSMDISEASSATSKS